MTFLRSATLLIALGTALSACSDGTGPGAAPRTVLLTNPWFYDYVALSIEETDAARPDTTAIYVATGTPVCLHLSAASQSPMDVVKLESFDATGTYLIATTSSVRPALASWTWDGVAPNTTMAPSC